MQWYRAYDGTVADPKLAEVALLAGVSKSVAVASWHAILENACSVGNGGEIDITPRRVAVMLSEPVPSIEAVFQAFEEVGLVNESTVTNWSKRQYQSDKSTDRVRRHRRKKAMEQGGTVSETFHETPETVSETDQSRTEQIKTEQTTSELHPSAGEIVQALGIVSPGYIAEAEEQIDVWLRLGVPFAALVEAATKSRGKKNPIGYMRSVVKPELEKIAKAKAAEAERKAKAKAGPDWGLIFQIYARDGVWPLYDHGPEPHKPGPHMFPQEYAEQYAAVIEHKRKIYEATRRPVDALEL